MVRRRRWSLAKCGPGIWWSSVTARQPQPRRSRQPQDSAVGSNIALANAVETGSVERTSTGAVIQLERIHKIYEMGDIQVHALRSASLSVQPGEFVAIM